MGTGQETLRARIKSSSAGAGDVGKVPVLNASGKLDESFGVKNSVSILEDIDIRELFCYGKLYTDEISQETYANMQNFGKQTSSPGNEKFGQEFTVGGSNIDLARLVIYLNKTGSPSDNVVCKIFANDKTTPVATAVTYPGSNLSTSAAWIAFDFSDQAVTLSASTQYFIELSRSGSVDGSNYYNVGYAGADIIAGDDHSTYYSSVWHDAVIDIMFKVQSAEAGYVLAAANDLETLDFIGISSETKTAGSTMEYKDSGIISGFTGLTPGAVYYLSDTPGAISTTAGTYERKVGRAISTTELLIERGSFEFIGSANDQSDVITVPDGARFAIVTIQDGGGGAGYVNRHEVFLVADGRLTATIRNAPTESAEWYSSMTATWDVGAKTITISGGGSNDNVVSGTAYFYK